MRKMAGVILCGCIPLVLCVFAMVARADDTTDPCSDTSCPVTCGGNGAVCVVHLKADTHGHTAKVMVKGTDAPLFCVASGTKVKWVAANARSFYAVSFKAKHTPFSQNLFLGDSYHPFSEPATNHGGTDRCYVYSFAICNGHGQCQHADPRVVVNGSP